MATEDFSVSGWSKATRYMGLAHGWPGAAWVWLHAVRQKSLPDDSLVRRAILARLKDAEAIRLPQVSHLVGSGCFPVVAALAAHGDPAFLVPFLRTLRLWIPQCERSEETDVMLGAAGAMLACAEIETLVPGQLPSRFIKALHRKQVRRVTRLLSDANRGAFLLLGFSHGLTGYLFALEIGHRVFGLPLSASLRTACLDTIAREKIELVGKRGIAWPVSRGDKSIRLHGWCHGGPGIALAFLYCFEMTGITTYRNLGLKAAEGTFLVKSISNTFCCGSAGRAQILLEAYRITRDAAWLRKAEKLAATVTQEVSKARARGFHQGRLGQKYLFWRLKDPIRLPLPALGPFSVSPSQNLQ